jgi:hypothetical protein
MKRDLNKYFLLLGQFFDACRELCSPSNHHKVGRAMMRGNHCTGYMGYPFQNEQRKSCVENLARYVDK